MKKCNVCGKEVEYKNEKGETIFISGIQFIVDCKNLPKEFVQKNLGKYEIGKEYNVCFECWFKSLGIKLDEP